MKSIVTIETALIITKLGVSPICCCPPSVGSSKSVILRHKICLWMGLIHLPFAIAASAYNIYLNRHDTVRVLKIMTEMTAMISVLGKMVICTIEAPRLQLLTAVMETFLKEANPQERELIQTYVDKCSVIHGVIFLSVILGPFLFIVAPAVTSQPYPGDVAYPFSTDSTWVWVIVYISQSIGTVQAGCMLNLDIFCGILLWYIGARIQLLSIKFRRATSADEVIHCARQHQELLRYAEQLKITISIIAAEVSIFAIFEIAACGLVLIDNPPPYELVKYVFFEIGTVTELFILSWPADNLIEVSQSLGDAAFSCDWVGKSPEMIKNLSIVVQRSRNPIVISVDGLFPILSLEFYGATIAGGFSYLTTLRAMTAE